ncbi:hypothetical protein PS15p_204011 [Mucor circinelloides]
MAFLVSSKSSPMLSNASHKEEVPGAVMSMNSTNNNPDHSLLRHYSLLTSSFLIEEDSLIESLPSLYFNEDDKKEDTEADDTEEDDDDYTTKEQKTPPADFTNMTTCLIKKAAAAAAASSSSPAAPLFPASSSSQSIIPPPIQTYSPQLNLSLYSPSPSVASSIRSTKKSRSGSSNSHHSYSLASSAATPSSIKSSCASSSSSSAFASSTAGRNPTLTSFNSIKRPTPLYSTAAISSSSKIGSTIKMDIRSPPQPSQSTSRFMNAFHRLRNSGSSSANIANQKNAPYHHQNTTNSVAPAEIVSTMKPSPSKSSLADKIKSKFHQQLDKKKNRASLVELSTKKRALSNFSMPRSTSLSSMTNWSSRLSGGNSNKSTPLKKGINVHNDKLKLSHSASASSRLSVSSSLSSSSSCSSSSSSLNSSSHRAAGDTSLFMPPQIATSTPATSPSAFSLTKSISSHRLYNKSSSEASSSNSDAASSSRHSHQATARPRQPLRAVNPNDSVRFVMRQSSPMSASGNSRKSSLQQQQQQQHQKTIVRFSKLVSVRETYSKADYDRGSDPDAVCTRLTPAMAQQIKEELNAYKLHEMQVHEYSRVHTHFFL